MATTVAPRKVPTVSVIHWVVCVSELAVWISSGLAIVGRIAERPAVKKGEATMSNALNK